MAQWYLLDHSTMSKTYNIDSGNLLPLLILAVANGRCSKLICGEPYLELLSTNPKKSVTFIKRLLPILQF